MASVGERDEAMERSVKRQRALLDVAATDIALLGEAASRIQAASQRQAKRRKRLAASPSRDDETTTTSIEPIVQPPARAAKAPPDAESPAETTTAKANKQATPTTRTNWAVGDSKERLERAVEEWDSASGRALHPGTGRKRSLREYSELVGIPYHTFRKYVGAKRRIVGQSTGRQPLLDPREQEWVAQKLADRGEGLLADDAVNVVLGAHPGLSRAQALRHIHRTLLKHNRNRLKVPPKRRYRKRGASNQKDKTTTGVSEEDTVDGEDDDDEEEEEEDEDDEDDDEEEEEAEASVENTANSNTDEDTDNSDTDEDSEIEGEEQEKEDAKPKPQPATGPDQKKVLLAAIDGKIAKLRSDLLDAELEKEKLLRAIKGG